MSANRNSSSGRNDKQTSRKNRRPDLIEEHSPGVETITLSSELASIKLADPIPPETVLGKILADRETGGRWVLREHIGTGGMAHIYRAHADDRRIPPRAVKMCQDKCEPHNLQTLSTALSVSQFNHPSFPRIFEHGRFQDHKLGDRRPAYLVLEELQKDPLTYLRHNKVLGLDEALHPNIALLIATDLLDHAITLQSKGLAHGDIHPYQVMLRMPRPIGDPVSAYCRRLESRQFETVVADCDTIDRMDEKLRYPMFTIGYTDPWFIPEEGDLYEYTATTDSYSIMATLYTLLTGHRLLPRAREPKGFSASAKAWWWKDVVTLKSLPNGPDSNLKALFTREEIYRATHPSVQVKIPVGRKRRQSWVDRMRGAQPELEFQYDDDQRSMESLIELLCLGLCSPRNRLEPIELRRFIYDSFKTHEETYQLIDPATGNQIHRRRSVPQPFSVQPSYSRRYRPQSGRFYRRPK